MRDRACGAKTGVPESEGRSVTVDSIHQDFAIRQVAHFKFIYDQADPHCDVTGLERQASSASPIGELGSALRIPYD